MTPETADKPRPPSAADGGQVSMRVLATAVLASSAVCASDARASLRFTARTVPFAGQRCRQADRYQFVIFCRVFPSPGVALTDWWYLPEFREIFRYQRTQDEVRCNAGAKHDLVLPAASSARRSGP